MSDDLRDALSAAMDESASATAPEPVVTPQAAPEPAPTPAAEPQEPKPAGDGPVRAANGQFAPKAEQAQATPNAESVPKAGAAVPAPLDLSRPPASLSAPVKAAWPTLSPEVQQDFVRREREAEGAIRERGEELNRLKPVSQALDPVRQRIGLSGLTEAQYVAALVNADEMLRGPNKAQALATLAQQYGIQLPAAQPQGQGQPQGQLQGQPTPEVQALRQQVSDLTAHFQQQQSQAEAARQAEVSRTIQAFAADPKNPYFANVQGRMSQLLAARQVEGSSEQERLQNAYEAACWADPTVRPLMTAAQAAGGQAQAAQQAHAQRARAAGVSVTGAPTVGGSPNGASASQSVRAALESAWDA